MTIYVIEIKSLLSFKFIEPKIQNTNQQKYANYYYYYKSIFFYCKICEINITLIVRIKNKLKN